MRSPRDRIILTAAPETQKVATRRISSALSAVALSVAAAVVAALVLAGGMSGCGRTPSSLLRQGQLPLYDFPLYVIESGAGQIQKIGRSGNSDKKVLISGLNNARSMATDVFNHLYVSEAGNNRIIKVDVNDGSYTVYKSGLAAPGPIAVDASGELFMVDESNNTVVRVADDSIFAVYSVLPTGIAFGVDGVLLVTMDSIGRVDWIRSPQALATGTTAAQFAAEADIVSVTGLNTPTNLSTDNMGRVYVAESVAGVGRLLRYHQSTPGSGTTIAGSLNFPAGMAVDPIGNTYVSEQGASAINIVTFDGSLYSGWTTGLLGPADLAFTRY
ncbi:MAG TPA: hypothetical protein VL588_11240 [Bdellovibrionota bacterium]|nr:hypothetical protein [Bdellovibrionota bacterium]